MGKYIVEFIGTFFLVLTIVCTVNGGVAMAPLAIGSMLMVMIYAGGHISGAHYNPAVTLSVFMRGKVAGSDVPGYVIAQLAGGAIAALIATKLLGFTAAEAPSDMNMAAGITAEILGTFALCWVILHTATTKSTAGNSYYGLAIGFTVLACAWGLGSFSGGAFNPAVGLGALTAGMTTVTNLGGIIVANLIGGALAAILFKVVYDTSED